MCLICDKEVYPKDKYFILAFEIPYYNLKIHYECYRENKDFIFKNVPQLGEKVYNIIVEEQSKKYGKTRNKR
jgi:hypothetical protein